MTALWQTVKTISAPASRAGTFLPLSLSMAENQLKHSQTRLSHGPRALASLLVLVVVGTKADMLPLLPILSVRLQLSAHSLVRITTDDDPQRRVLLHS